MYKITNGILNMQVFSPFIFSMTTFFCASRCCLQEYLQRISGRKIKCEGKNNRAELPSPAWSIPVVNLINFSFM